MEIVQLQNIDTLRRFGNSRGELIINKNLWGTTMISELTMEYMALSRVNQYEDENKRDEEVNKSTDKDEANETNDDVDSCDDSTYGIACASYNSEGCTIRGPFATKCWCEGLFFNFN